MTEITSKYALYRDLTPQAVFAGLHGFVGREWTLSPITEWLTDTTTRFFVITGKPGAGKSTLAAWLTGMGPTPISAEAADRLHRIRDMVKGVHYCRSDSGSNSPRAFAASMAAQLDQTTEGYRSALQATFGPSIKVEGIVYSDKIESGAHVTGLQVDLGTLAEEAAFDYAFREPLQRLYRESPATQMLLIVDALDEALTYTGPSLHKLMGRLSELPLSVRILVTTRPDPRVLTIFHRSATLDLIDDEPTPGDDIKAYVTSRANSTNADATKLDRVGTSAKGVFLYASLVLDSLSRHQTDTQDSVPLPENLTALYHDFLLRELAADDRTWHDRYKPLLGLLAIAREPGLKRQLLDAILGYDTTADLRACGQFLVGDILRGPLQMFHQSFIDYLRSEDNEYGVDPVQMHNRIASFYLSEFATRRALSDDYGFRNLPWHLQASDRREELAQLLTNFNWLSAKLSRLKIGSLLADFELIPLKGYPAVNELQQAIRLSGSALSADDSQLGPQLIGRLKSEGQHPDLLTMLEHISVDGPWIRPRNLCLNPPGSPLVRIMKGHSNRVNALAVTPDGRQIVSASSDHRVLIWDFGSGAPLRELKGHDEGVNDVVTTPDGSLVISASGDVSSLSAEASLVTWDFHTGEIISRLNRQDDYRIATVRLTSDGKHAVCAVQGYTNTILILTIPSLNTVLEIQESYEGPTDAIVVSLNDRLVVAASGYMSKDIQAWSLSSGHIVYQTQLADGCTCLAPMPDDEVIVTGLSGDNDILLCQGDGFAEVRRLEGHTDRVKAVAVTPDGRYIASGSADSTVRLWDARTGSQLAVLTGHTAEVEALAISPNGQFVVSAGRDNTIRVWDIQDAINLHPTPKKPQAIKSLAISARGERVLGGCLDGTVREWDFATGRETTILHRSAAGAPWVALSNQDLASYCFPNGEAVSQFAGGVTKQVHAGHDIRHAVFSPSGRYLAVAYEDVSCEVWDLATGKPTVAYRGHQEHGHNAAPLAGWTTHFIRDMAFIGEDRVISVALTFDRGLFWIDPMESTMAIWSARDAASIATHKWWDTTSGAIASDSSRSLVYSGEDEIVGVRRASDGQLVGELRGHGNTVQVISTSQDGKYVATSASDGALKVWDANSRTALATLIPDDEVTCLAISSAHRLVAADRGGRILMLDLLED